MFGYCCKCNEGNPQYYGSGGGSGSGGGLYFNPYGVGGGCDVCPTVPYAFTAEVVLDAACPCATYGGTFELQHVSSGYHQVQLPFPSGVCDVWASAERAKDEGTCAESATTPRVELVLYSYLGNYNWRLAIHYMEGPFIGQAHADSGFSDCFQTLTLSAFFYDFRFPCIVTSADVTAL